jgi:hypothetical protein
LTQLVTAANDAPRTLGLRKNEDGTVTVSFAGVPGVQYVVQATISLQSPVAWANISTNVAGPDGLWIITEPTTNFSQRFYRSAKLQSQALVVSERPTTLGLTDNHDGTVTVNFAGTPGGQYVVQAANSLNQPIVWLDIFTNIAGLDARWKYTDSVLAHPQRFYRAAKLIAGVSNPIVLQPPQDAGIHNNGNGTFTISFIGTPGGQYLIQAASTLGLPLNWLTLSTNTAGVNGLYSITDSFSNFAQRYYRSVIP